MTRDAVIEQIGPRDVERRDRGRNDESVEDRRDRAYAGLQDRPRHRHQLRAADLTQDLYIGNSLKTGRIMAKDEDVCLHCGLCAERCPTGAWDMQKFLFESAMAGARAKKLGEAVA